MTCIQNRNRDMHMKVLGYSEFSGKSPTVSIDMDTVKMIQSKKSLDYLDFGWNNLSNIIDKKIKKGKGLFKLA